MRVATWNVNSLKARLERLTEWLAYAEPDVLCLQETKMADAAFPALEISALGYDSVHHGEGRWNGVAILSRVGLTDAVSGFADGGAHDPEARIVTATCGGIHVSSVYVPNGREVGSDHYRYKLDWLARLRAHLDATCTPADDVVVAGDFNVALDDRDVYDPAAYVGATHVTEEERRGVRALLDWGMVDVFRRHYDADGLFTWWDYRAGNFHKHKGMRIDLVLATEPLAARSTWSLIDRQARKGKSPSDHAPLLAEFTDA